MSDDQRADTPPPTTLTQIESRLQRALNAEPMDVGLLWATLADVRRSIRAAAEPAARGDFPNPPDEDPPDFPVPIEPPDEPAAAEPLDLDRLTEFLHDLIQQMSHNDHQFPGQCTGTHLMGMGDCQVEARRYLERAAQPPRGSLPDEELHGGYQMAAAAELAGGSLTATEPPDSENE